MQSPSSPQQPRWNFLTRLLDNPVILKELKGRMRGRQGFVTLTVYLGLLSLFVAVVYWFLRDNSDYSHNAFDELQAIGKALFAAVILTELLLIAFIGPALTSGAIASERERQTFDLLRASLISPRELLFGKLFSAVAYLLLLIFAAVPVQSLAFFVGGVGLPEMIVSFLILVASAFLFCMLGLYFSTVSKRAVISTSVSYGFLVIPVIVEVIAVWGLAVSSFSPERMSDAGERLFILSLWTLISVNPLAAAALSEVMLVEEHSIFLIYPPSMSPQLVLFSPWILYLVYAVALTVSMIWLSVFYLKRYEY